MTLSKWCDRAWIKVGLALSIVAMIWLLIDWFHLSMGVKVLAGIGILIPIHVIEEWLFPGGFHYMYNRVIYRSEQPNHFPMNRVSDMFTNFMVTLFYLALAIIYAVKGGEVPIGIILGTLVFCCIEFCAHTVFGFMMWLNFKAKGKTTIYGPGSLTCYFGFVPLGCFCYYMLRGVSLCGYDWLAAAGVIAYIAFWVFVPEGITRKTDTPYYFKSADYFDRFLKK